MRPLLCAPHSRSNRASLSASTGSGLIVVRHPSCLIGDSMILIRSVKNSRVRAIQVQHRILVQDVSIISLTVSSSGTLDGLLTLESGKGEPQEDVIRGGRRASMDARADRRSDQQPRGEDGGGAWRCFFSRFRSNGPASQSIVMVKGYSLGKKVEGDVDLGSRVLCVMICRRKREFRRR